MIFQWRDPPIEAQPHEHLILAVGFAGKGDIDFWKLKHSTIAITIAFLKSAELTNYASRRRRTFLETLKFKRT